MCKMALVVPSTIDTNVSVDNSEYVELVVREFCKLNGGATCEEGKGYYVANDGTLVVENVTTVSSFSTMKKIEAKRHLFALAQTIKRLMTQECVLVTIDNSCYFV